MTTFKSESTLLSKCILLSFKIAYLYVRWFFALTVYNSQLLLAVLAWTSLCKPLLRLKIFILFEICLGGTLCLGIECSR